MSCYPNIVAMSKFIFPKDSSGRKLGSFPKNYESIPSQLTSYKTYHEEFIIPVTPVSSKYTFVYQHNGIDFMAVFGTPIYSPVDGTLQYSEWGHTVNQGWDETAYSASIVMDRPVTFNGKTIGQIFLTHMSGIRYRCSNCNIKVKKGQLLGFSGNAAGTASKEGWAPHLHMSMYPVGNYDQGLQTRDIEELYNLSSGMTLNAGG
jgi:murein DD-endopeptidase MepM/ murein hydrolase activator NlpD